MPIRPRHDDDWPDDFDPLEDAADEWDDDSWDEYDDVDEDEPTIPCPYCRREIHEDAQRCPHCNRYISDEDAPPPRNRWWIIAGTLACLYIFYRWIFG